MLNWFKMVDDENYGNEDDEDWEQKSFLEGMEDAEEESEKKEKDPFTKHLEDAEEELEDFSK